MNSKRGFVVIGIILFLMVGIVLFFMGQAHIIQRYFFKGDHITVNLKVFVDDKELSLDKVIVKGTFEKKDCKVDSKKGTITTKGGNYGMYKFTFTIPKEQLNEYGKDVLLSLNYLNANDWYISSSDCVIYLKTEKNNTLSGKTSVNVKYNDNTTKNYNDDLKSIDDFININWGL